MVLNLVEGNSVYSACVSAALSEVAQRVATTLRWNASLYLIPTLIECCSLQSEVLDGFINRNPLQLNEDDRFWKFYRPSALHAREKQWLKHRVWVSFSEKNTLVPKFSFGKLFVLVIILENFDITHNRVHNFCQISFRFTKTIIFLLSHLFCNSQSQVRYDLASCSIKFSCIV